MSNWAQGFVGALTQSLAQAQAQLLSAQAKKTERQQLFAKTLLERGLETGDVDSQAAGWTLLLDPKADPANPEKSKEYQRALKIGHLTEHMKAGPPGSQIRQGPPGGSTGGPTSPPEAIAGPPTGLPSGGPPSPLGRDSSPGALPSTSPTTGGQMNLIPTAQGAAAMGGGPTPPPGPPEATPPPTPSPQVPPTNQDHISSWDEGLQKVDEYIRQLGQPNVPAAIRAKEYQKAADLRSTLQAYKAAGIPVTPENVQDVIAGVNPTAARIGAQRDMATMKASQAEKLERLKQEGRVALEKAKEAFKTGAAQVELDDDEAKALGLPSAGYIDKEVLKQLEANHRANIAAGARVRAAEVSGQNKVTITVDPDGNRVYHVGTAGLEGAPAPLAGGMEQQVTRAEAAISASDGINQLLKTKVVRDNLGAISGRITMGEFLYGGNIPPELAELRGSLKGYILAAYGVHGLRNAREADRDYHEMLSMRFSPETISSTLRGYNKILGSFASARPKRRVTPPPGSSTIEDLRKKYNLPAY